MEFLYRISQDVGFNHPLHPALTHMPIGLVISAFIFLIVAITLKRNSSLTKTAYYCIVLALIFLFPTAFLGYTDWLHFYAGVWLFPFKIKIVLTIMLLIFLIIVLIMEMKNMGGLISKAVIYLLCVICVIGLGYYGGELVFADKIAGMQEEVKDGEALYATNCSSCHPNGGNIIMSSLPVINSSKLKNLDEFTNYCRSPRKPDGSLGAMPAFSKEKLSDQQLTKLYQYIINSLAIKRS
jgi:uncharacterized membrane protein